MSSLNALLDSDFCMNSSDWNLGCVVMSRGRGVSRGRSTRRLRTDHTRPAGSWLTAPTLHPHPLHSKREQNAGGAAVSSPYPQCLQQEAAGSSTTGPLSPRRLTTATGGAGTRCTWCSLGSPSPPRPCVRHRWAAAAGGGGVAGQGMTWRVAACLAHTFLRPKCNGITTAVRGIVTVVCLRAFTTSTTPHCSCLLALSRFVRVRTPVRTCSPLGRLLVGVARDSSLGKTPAKNA